MNINQREEKNQNTSILDLLNKSEEYNKYINKYLKVMFICSHKGAGVFAKEDLPHNFFLGEYRGKKLSLEEWDEAYRKEVIPCYLYFLQNGFIRGSKEDIISLVNDHDKPNAIMSHLTRDRVGLFTLYNGKSIKQSEEIVYSYDKPSSLYYLPWRHQIPLSYTFQNERGLPEVEDSSKYCTYCQVQFKGKKEETHQTVDDDLQQGSCSALNSTPEETVSNNIHLKVEKEIINNNLLNIVPIKSFSEHVHIKVENDLQQDFDNSLKSVPEDTASESVYIKVEDDLPQDYDNSANAIPISPKEAVELISRYERISRPCPFCKKFIKRFSQHLQNKHKKEKEVVAINRTENKLERKRKYRQLLIRGIRASNEIALTANKEPVRLKKS